MDNHVVYPKIKDLKRLLAELGDEYDEAEVVGFNTNYEPDDLMVWIAYIVRMDVDDSYVDDDPVFDQQDNIRMTSDPNEVEIDGEMIPVRPEQIIGKTLVFSVG